MKTFLIKYGNFCKNVNVNCSKKKHFYEISCLNNGADVLNEYFLDNIVS